MPVHTVHLRLPFNARCIHVRSVQWPAGGRSIKVEPVAGRPKSSPLLAVPTQWAVALANAHEAHFFYPAGLRQSESARSPARVCTRGPTSLGARPPSQWHALRQPGPRSESSSVRRRTNASAGQTQSPALGSEHWQLVEARWPSPSPLRTAAQRASDRGRHHRDSDAGSNAGRGSPPRRTLSQPQPGALA